jgi:hypothetical protein
VEDERYLFSSALEQQRRERFGDGAHVLATQDGPVPDLLPVGMAPTAIVN